MSAITGQPPKNLSPTITDIDWWSSIQDGQSISLFISDPDYTNTGSWPWKVRLENSVSIFGTEHHRGTITSDTGTIGSGVTIVFPTAGDYYLEVATTSTATAILSVDANSSPVTFGTDGYAEGSIGTHITIPDTTFFGGFIGGNTFTGVYDDGDLRLSNDDSTITVALSSSVTAVTGTISPTMASTLDFPFLKTVTLGAQNQIYDDANASNFSTTAVEVQESSSDFTTTLYMY